MRSVKVLEMLDEGRIDELKSELRDEVYNESLASKPNVKKRYAAMKKYFTYRNSVRECLTKPYVIEFEGKKYTSFCNSFSLAFTIESCGEMELFDGKYPDVARLIRFDGIKKKIDFGKVMAEAKSKGYRLKKSEVNNDSNSYYLLYDDTYYNLALLDITYRIIDDGKVSMVYHPYGERMPITIQTDIGIAMVMPVYITDKLNVNEDKVIGVD